MPKPRLAVLADDAGQDRSRAGGCMRGRTSGRKRRFGEAATGVKPVDAGAVARASGRGLTQRRAQEQSCRRHTSGVTPAAACGRAPVTAEAGALAARAE
ncbi:MAG: hypothetical protein D6815_10275, partial [Candidatus Dadabacteria bacterium]